MMFSRRTAWEQETGHLAGMLARRNSSGLPTLDLTRSNPTEAGFPVPSEMLRELSRDEVGRYDPDPLGMVTAREAVAAYYADHGAKVAIEDVVLTASTSEAYSYLFHLLCDPGDEILVAEPSYPLFDLLADLADVRLRAYRLFYDHGWSIDFASLEEAITPRTRAVVLVHPNNPTGNATYGEEKRRLQQICVTRGLALIVDEVFLDYWLLPPKWESFASGQSPGLLFVLSGLSKVLGMPQMKVGWIVVRGPEAQSREALRRLDVIADTFLSVNTPAQVAMPRWLHHWRSRTLPIRAAVSSGLDELFAAGLEVLRLDAGWSAVLRLPATHEGPWAERLLHQGVLVQPGSFYGIRESGRVVVSLLTPTAVLREGSRIIASLVAEDLASASDR